MTVTGAGGLPRAIRRAWWWTTFTWMAVVVTVSCLRLLVGPESFGGVGAAKDAWVIALASLGIAYASMLPVLVGHRWRRSRPGCQSERNESEGTWQLETGQLVAGVMIRLVGTVALFLTCRYQMATPTELVAAMTIGWYVLLTVVDIAVLARELPTSTGPTPLEASRLRSESPATTYKV